MKRDIVGQGPIKKGFGAVCVLSEGRVSVNFKGSF
jgi:hypothetical protein